MTNKDEEKGLFHGKKGESIFTKPFIPDLSGSMGHNIEMPKLFEKTKKAGDDRSLAIVAALIVEHNIDRILKIWIPSKLINDEDDHDFTFSMKIRLIKAFKLIPPHILECADCIRKIRNDFGHNLDLDNFDQKSIDRLKTSYHNSCLYKYYDSYYENSEPKSTLELFDTVAFIAISGIRSYETNIAILRETIQSDEFLEKLESDSIAKYFKEIEEVKQLGPIETKFENGQKIEIFQKGYAEISRDQNKII